MLILSTSVGITTQLFSITYMINYLQKYCCLLKKSKINNKIKITKKVIIFGGSGILKIIFKNKSVEKQFCSAYAKKWKYPKQVTMKLIAMENFLKSSNSLSDVIEYKPYNFHQMHGRGEGEWNLYVGNTGYRVTVMPCNEDEETIVRGDIISLCKSIKIVKVTEVSNHYE